MQNVSDYWTIGKGVAIRNGLDRTFVVLIMETRSYSDMLAAPDGLVANVDNQSLRASQLFREMVVRFA
jgi:hypothetical protein